jgi:glycosyltransferase involved in cell wall biosynthesis
MALPIAAFNGPGISEAVVDHETALLSPYADHADLAENICAILADPNLAARLGAAGRRRAQQHFSLATQTALLENTYDEVLMPVLKS